MRYGRAWAAGALAYAPACPAQACLCLCPAAAIARLFRGLKVTLPSPLGADPAARNVTLELTSKPADAAGGTAPPPLAQQLKGLFSGLVPDAA